jgi:hypothetical protein
MNHRLWSQWLTLLRRLTLTLTLLGWGSGLSDWGGWSWLLNDWCDGSGLGNLLDGGWSWLLNLLYGLLDSLLRSGGCGRRHFFEASLL